MSIGMGRLGDEVCTWGVPVHSLLAPPHPGPRAYPSTARLHHMRAIRMSYWWAMGRTRKATSLQSSPGLGPMARSAVCGP